MRPLFERPVCSLRALFDSLAEGYERIFGSPKATER
jgi:hypothetical protein